MERPYFANQTMAPTSGKRLGLQDDVRTALGLRRYDDLLRRRPLKYCPRTEPSVENCGSPTLSFGELLDFSLSFWPRDSAAWPAAFQIILKNNDELSLFELLRDLFTKRFQGNILRHLNDNG
jgi:hypothetical protein